MATTILKAVYTTNNRRKNEELVNVIKSGLSDLKNKIEEMSTDESEIEKPYKIVNIAEKILDFNRQNQEGEGLKILAPEQMLSKFKITQGYRKKFFFAPDKVWTFFKQF